MIRVAALIGILSSAGACDHTAEDCTRLIAAINESGNLAAPTGSAPQAAASVERSRAMDLRTRSTSLGQLQLRSEQVRPKRDVYVAMLSELAGATDAWAEAVEQLSQARDRGEEARRRLDDALRGLDALCTDSTCYAVMRRIAATKPADDVTAATRQLADDLAELSTGEAAVDTALVAYVKQVAALASALAEMDSAEPSVVKASERRRAALTAEAAIVQQLNAACR
jgi:exonuclease VII small subunit